MRNMRKREMKPVYEKPSVKVFELEPRSHLLQASGGLGSSATLSIPDSYVGGGDPFTSLIVP